MISFIRRSTILLCSLAFLLECRPAVAQPSPLVLPHDDSTIALAPYAPNILRATLSLQRESALAKQGYGLVDSPNDAGWSATQTPEADI